MQKNRKVYVAGLLVVLLAAGILVKMQMDRSANNADQSDAVDSAIATKAPRADPSTTSANASPETAAVAEAAGKHRYVFLTFYRKNDDPSSKMQTALKPLQAKFSDRADFISVDRDDPSQGQLVSRYGADSAPMPLTLVIAPNGAVTAGYPKELPKADVSAAFVSDGMASVLKVLQSQKIAAVCVQGTHTKNNQKSLSLAKELKASPQLGGSVEVVKIDPFDQSEAKFMKTCKVDTHSASASLVVLAPPGKLIGKFDGTATKDAVLTTVTSALSGGG